MDSRGKFTVTLYNAKNKTSDTPTLEASVHYDDERGLVEFCRTPRSRAEIVDYLAISSVQYALRRYLDPLVQANVILMTIPDKPRSPNQKYYTAENI